MRPGLCLSCSDRVAGWLADLPALVARVADAAPVPCCDTHAGKQPTAGPTSTCANGARVSGSASTPLPGGVDRLSWLGMAGTVHSLANAGCQTGNSPVAPVLASWAQLVAETLAVTPPRAGRLVHGPHGSVARCSSADVPALVTFLQRWHEQICAEPWADEYAQEIHQQWQTGRALAGDTERSLQIGWCITLLEDGGTCDEALYAQPSDTVIRCRGCGADWTRELWLILGAAMEEMSG